MKENEEIMKDNQASLRAVNAFNKRTCALIVETKMDSPIIDEKIMSEAQKGFALIAFFQTLPEKREKIRKKLLQDCLEQ